MSLFKKIFGDAIDGIKDRIEDIKDEVQDRIDSIKDEVQDRIDNIKDEVQDRLGGFNDEVGVKEAPQSEKVQEPTPKEALIPKTVLVQETKVEEPVPEPISEQKAEASDNGLFSARLEAMITAALQDGVLTEKERELLKRRVEKEGEDWDEVEMIIEARLAEMKPTSPAPQIEKTTTKPLSSVANVEENNVAYKVIVCYTKDIDDSMAYDLEDFLKDILNIKPSLNLWDFSHKKAPQTIVEGLSKTKAEFLKLLIEFNGFVAEIQESRGITIDDSITVSSICKRSINNVEKESIFVPEGITVLAEEAFRGYEMKKISLPSTLVKIEKEVFRDCETLESIDFSRCKTLTVIEDYAFCGCEKLKKVILPDSVKRIGESAFSSCGCETIVLPASLEEIGEGAFNNSNLRCIDFSHCSKLEQINDRLFMDLQLQSLDLSGTNIKYIGDYAFSYNEQLTTIVLPKTLVKIGEGAFNCTPLTEIVIPDSVKFIGDAAFKETQLMEIVIPDSVEHIGSKAFADNEQLRAATIGRSAKDYFYEHKYPNGPIFENTPNLTELTFKSEVTSYTGAKALTKVTFCDTVKEIGKWSCSECAELEEVVIPDSVTKIGYGAFVACENLSSVVLPDNITEIGEGAFSETKLKEIVFPRELCKIGRLANDYEKLRKLDFSKVTKLKVIPENFIGDNTPKLKEIAFPIGVERIEECIGAENLDRLFIPPTIKEIEDPCQVNIDIYCFSPKIEELEPIVEGIEDEEDGIRLHVLPEYVESYKAQRDAEGLSDKILTIDVMPEEFRYYYDN